MNKVTPVMLQEIFDLWNEQKITVHGTFDHKTKKKIKQVLEEYPIEEVRYSITAYADALHGDWSFWTYKWIRLEYFMQRGFQKFLEETDPYERCKKGNNPFNRGVGSPPPESAPLKFVGRFEEWKKTPKKDRAKLKAKWEGEESKNENKTI